MLQCYPSSYVTSKILSPLSVSTLHRRTWYTAIHLLMLPQKSYQLCWFLPFKGELPTLPSICLRYLENPITFVGFCPSKENLLQCSPSGYVTSKIPSPLLVSPLHGRTCYTAYHLLTLPQKSYHLSWFLPFIGKSPTLLSICLCYVKNPITSVGFCPFIGELATLLSIFLCYLKNPITFVGFCPL